LNFDKLVSQSLVVGLKRKYISALIVQNREELEIYLKSNGFVSQEIGDLKHNKEVLEIYGKCIGKVNSGLSDYEQIRKFCLIDREFSQELDEVTPTLKIRRHAIEHHFRDEIEGMY
jgi:long-chain acyl-CoA synthetase